MQSKSTYISEFVKPEDINDSAWRGSIVYYKRYFKNLQEKKKHMLKCLDDFRIKIAEMVLNRFEISLDAPNPDDKRFITELQTKIKTIRQNIDKFNEQITTYKTNSYDLICQRARQYMTSSN